VHCVKIMTLPLTPKNVIDVVQSEGNRNQIRSSRRKYDNIWRRACVDRSQTRHVTSRHVSFRAVFYSLTEIETETEMNILSLSKTEGKRKCSAKRKRNTNVNQSTLNVIVIETILISHRKWSHKMFFLKSGISVLSFVDLVTTDSSQL